ncbi:MAG TPA: deoxyribose-phosphate aldolase [Puia sp.]|nr:deoxyribose-phosphate aldolase [Puia sp.]
MDIRSYIDHTLLKHTATLEQISILCEEAKENRFAAVCVPPPFVRHARKIIADSRVKVSTVIGFPLGYSAVEAKIAEIVLAVVDGADELDMVVNISALKNNDWQYLAGEINAILPIVHGKKRALKVIIETGILTDEEIVRCCLLYGTAGVDFLKTSTGFVEKGASVEAVSLMKERLPEAVGIKASGGIKTFEFACKLIEAGATRIGCSSSISIIRESDNRK